MSKINEQQKKVTIPFLMSSKKSGEKITMLTAYDATFARLLDNAGIEMILVGDSLGSVIQGHANTIPVTVEDIIYHTRAVVRGVSSAHVVADMPFMSYQTSIADAMKNAGRLMKEGGAESVKLEVGLESVETVRALVSSGIPVMAHIGLKPQSVHTMGGYKIQGRTLSASDQLVEEARAFEGAGAYALLLEGVAIETARTITETVSIPTIGISSGPYCDGQVLVIYDLLGMDEDFSPKFLKKYTNFAADIKNAVGAYIKDVKEGAYPTEENGFSRIVTVVKEVSNGNNS